MKEFTEIITRVNERVNSLVWGPPMIALIVGTGIYLTLRLGFFQVVRARFITKKTLGSLLKGGGKSGDKKALSQYQALATALAGTIGTGNIAGVATAIAAGGAGAVFWMWFSAFFGMMTHYAEVVLALYFRRKNSRGEWSGGAMYYLEKGVGEKRGPIKHLGKPLAIAFAVFCLLASFGIGNMTQVNSIADIMRSSFGVPGVVTGVALAFLSALVIVGGVGRIGQVTEKLVPFMSLLFMTAAAAIIIINRERIPEVFAGIFRGAFSTKAIAGGAYGTIMKNAVSMGFKRGVFSNEAGLGSSALVHAAADVKEPVEQGMWGIFEVFFDTIVVCSMTALVLLSAMTGASENVPIWTYEEAVLNAEKTPQYCLLDDGSKSGADKLPLVSGDPMVLPNAGGDVYTHIQMVRVFEGKNGEAKFEEVTGASLMGFVFESALGPWAGKALAIAMALFAYSTLLGWSFYGLKSLEYLSGARSAAVYRLIFIAAIVLGATMELGLAWSVSDTLNGLMAIPNLFGIILLSGQVVRITGNYKKRKLSKKHESVTPMVSAYKT